MKAKTRVLTCGLILLASFSLLHLGRSAPPPGTNPSVSIDPSGNYLPLTRNGFPPNLPAGTKLDGSTLTSGSTTFLGLTDTPDSYSGQGGKAVRVNVAANGLEFYTPSTFSGVFTDLDFTASNLTAIVTRSYNDLQNLPTIPTISDTAYDATSWNANLDGASKNAIRDKIETLQPLDSDLTAISALSTTSFGRGGLTQADAAAFRSYIGAGASSFSGLYTDLDFTSSNLTSIATRNFGALQNTPTTLTGYGITDALSSSTTLSTTAPLLGGGTVGSNLTLSIQTADATHAGAVSISDWNLFNTAANSAVTSLAGENYITKSGNVLTANSVNLSGTHATGTLAAGRFPALTGDTTTSAGSLATTTSKVNGVSYGTSPSTNTVPVVTGTNATTYQTVPNAALSNSSFTLGSTSISLGGTATTATGITSPVNPSDIAPKNYVDAQIAAISNQGSGYTGVITGCGVAYTGLLNFTVGSGSGLDTYSINGTTYTLTQTNLTLAAADPTNARFDVIVVNTSGVADVVQGTPANPALIPTVDPATQLYLTAVSVPAGATTPGNITNTVLYAENAGSPTEWTSSSSGTTWALASTNNPHLGTKDVEATSLTGGAYVQLQKPSGTLDLSTQNSLVFYIRSKASWNANRSITIEFLNAGAIVGNPLTFREGSFGFVSSNTSSYQQILIPISSFNVGNTVVNQIRFIAAGSGGSAIGYYLDDVSLQAGVNLASQNFLAWRSTWSSSTAYVKNDAVSYGTRGWVALQPNTNSTPSDTNTNWQSIGTVSGVTGNTNVTDGKVLIGKSSDNSLNLATITQGSGITITNGGGSITIAASGSGITVGSQVDSYTTAQSATSWVKPSGAVRIEIYAIGGGGSGAGGRSAATATAGGGGGGGAFSYVSGIAASFDSTLKVTVGGGGAQTTQSANGVAGNDGNPSFVTNNAAGTTYVYAQGGKKGNCISGTSTGGEGGCTGQNLVVDVTNGWQRNQILGWGFGGLGGARCIQSNSNTAAACPATGTGGGAGGAGDAGGNALTSGYITSGGGATLGGGGGGGGQTTQTDRTGGSGGAPVWATQAQGAAGQSAVGLFIRGGQGGAGGGNTTHDGGAGGAPGGGGGGGTNTSTSGKGGAGADGAVVIITSF